MATGGSNIDATLETDEPVPSSSANSSAWFRWVSPTTGTVRADTIGSDFDTMLAVWAGGELNGLSLITYNDDSGGLQSEVTFNVVAGTTYQIAVYGYASAQGNIILNLSPAPVSNSKITGMVTGSDGLTGLQDIYVSAYRWTGAGWDEISSAYTDADGNYEIGVLMAGTYRVTFRDWSGSYVGEVYNNIPGDDYYNSGENIVVPEGGVVSDINASLAMASKITGTVTDGANGLPDISVEVWRSNGEFGWSGHTIYTDAGGYFEAGGLAAGTYRVTFHDENGNYVAETYNNIPGNNLWSGTDITVPEASTVPNINASLAMASKITGTVTDGTTGLSNIYVSGYRWNGSGWDYSSYDYTGSDGTYELGGLAAGTYRVIFRDWAGSYVPETYSNLPGADVWSQGTPIDVPEVSTVSNINAALDEYASLAGNVAQADGTTPISGVRVVLMRGSEIEQTDWTDVNGAYGFSQLYPGDYTVRTDPPAGIGYLGEWYDNGGLYVPGQDTPPAEATVITLGSGENRTGINFALDPGGRISGMVTGNGGLPFVGGYVKAKNSTYGIVSVAPIGDTGAYELAGLLPGDYTLKAGAEEFADEWWPNATHEDRATPFVVTNGSDLVYDFELLSGQNPALVEVRCDPEVNATIYVDYQATTNVTPTVLDIGEVASHSVGLGEWVIASHVITLKKAGLPRPPPCVVPAVEAETVNMTIDMTSSAEGGLSIATIPGGADVFIDYADVADGVTPLVVDHLAPGSHTILLRKDGYLQARPIVAQVETGITSEISIPLASVISADRIMGEVQSSPTGAVIYVDYLPTTEITDAVIDWMDPASHSGAGWHSASHTIMLRKPWHMPGAPRYVPEVTNAVQTNHVQLIVDTVAVADEDKDGMPDQWEAPYQDLFGWPDQGPDDDYDGDGVSNYGEMIAGTHPGNPDSVFEINRANLSSSGINRTMAFVFNSIPGHRYFVRGSASLGDTASWINLSGVILATNSQTSYTATLPENLKFFQLVVWAP